MHVNLFADGDEREVYSGLQRDFKRDGRQTAFLDLVGFVALYWLVRDWKPGDMLAAYALLVSFVAATRTFFDNSNRNFLMHAIDFEVNQRHDAATRPPMSH